LAGLIVKRVRDTLCLLFQHLVEVAQRRIRFAKSAVRHLIGRNAFGKKLRGFR
jgi:hypothetical protein